MKKVIGRAFTILFPSALYSFFTFPVNAEDIPSPTDLETIGDLITKVSGIVTPLAVLGFIFSVIYAGFVRMTAAGNPEKEGKSMKIAVGAAIGFAIIALAPLLVKLLANLLNIDDEIIL